MKTVTLKEYGLGLYDDRSTFELGDLELAINGLPSKSGQFRFSGFCNGRRVVSENIEIEDNRVVIPKKALEAGKFSAFVSHLSDGQEIKRYPIESLLIADTKCDLAAEPEIAALTAEIAVLKEEAKDAKTRLTAAESALSAQAMSILELEKRLGVLEKNHDILEN